MLLAYPRVVEVAQIRRLAFTDTYENELSDLTLADCKRIVLCGPTYRSTDKLFVVHETVQALLITCLRSTSARQLMQLRFPSELANLLNLSHLRRLGVWRKSKASLLTKNDFTLAQWSSVRAVLGLAWRLERTSSFTCPYLRLVELILVVQGWLS